LYRNRDSYNRECNLVLFLLCALITIGRELRTLHHRFVLTRYDLQFTVDLIVKIDLKTRGINLIVSNRYQIVSTNSNILLIPACTDLFDELRILSVLIYNYELYYYFTLIQFSDVDLTILYV
jgi:hypothetical protein